MNIIKGTRVYRLAASDYEPVRPELTSGITGRTLVPKETRSVGVAVTKVEPGGEFSPHRDAYHHVIYVAQGAGEVRLGEGVYAIGPDTVVEVRAGEVHAYRNTGDSPMLLLTLNIYEET